MALAAALGALCTAFAQQPARIPNVIEPNPDRYQVTGLNADNAFILLDSHTGQCWIKSPIQAWQDLGSPAKPIR
jgi:hypothetical protein